MIKNTIVLTFIIIQIGCSSSQSNNSTTENSNADRKVYASHNNEGSDDCGFNDDTYPATVEYNNPETGHNATYDLDVVVEDCQVVEIDFPKGGWLDGDHIDATDLDENGDASVEDDKGRTFDVHIDESNKKEKEDKSSDDEDNNN